MIKTAIRVVCALSIASTLIGCAHSNSAPANASITIGRDCESLAQEVPAPAMVEGGDVFASVAEHRVALLQANRNIRTTRTCQVKQRGRLQGGR